LGGFGYAGIFLLCFICNATVLAPAPSLAVVVSASLALNPLFVALSGAAGTTFGETVGYAGGIFTNKYIGNPPALPGVADSYFIRL
jgi:membrane protein YqaA with SNARE-associated domain